MCLDITKQQYDDYVLRRKVLASRIEVLLLTRIGAKDFIDEWESSRKAANSYKKFLITCNKLARAGTGLFIKIGRLRSIGDNIYELKEPSSVKRVMCCAVDDCSNVIMLFAFDGHKGTGQIPPEVVKRAKRLEKIAVSLYEKEKHCD
ncbi:MAG: hypothetical protein LBM21_02320 [Coriobacteriales bacterium]|jgi:hypothetical protein|nr:hypothetical protein [Coriobacteriales bacterium]